MALKRSSFSLVASSASLFLVLGHKVESTGCDVLELQVTILNLELGTIDHGLPGGLEHSAECRRGALRLDALGKKPVAPSKRRAKKTCRCPTDAGARRLPLGTARLPPLYGLGEARVESNL